MGSVIKEVEVLMQRNGPCEGYAVSLDDALMCEQPFTVVMVELIKLYTLYKAETNDVDHYG